MWRCQGSTYTHILQGGCSLAIKQSVHFVREFVIASGVFQSFFEVLVHIQMYFYTFFNFVFLALYFFFFKGQCMWKLCFIGILLEFLKHWSWMHSSVTSYFLHWIETKPRNITQFSCDVYSVSFMLSWFLFFFSKFSLSGVIWDFVVCNCLYVE